MMGGRLWLESPPGRGATFHFTVQVRVRPDAIAPAPAVEREERTPSPGALRILLAEDNRVNRFLAVRLLEKAGHHVQTATNGRAAIAALEERFDLALMDLQMPEMDGLEATALIRERERATGAICRSSRSPRTRWSATRSAASQAGMDGYVSKPIDIKRLLAEIRRVQATLETQA